MRKASSCIFTENASFFVLASKRFSALDEDFLKRSGELLARGTQKSLLHPKLKSSSPKHPVETDLSILIHVYFLLSRSNYLVLFACFLSARCASSLKIGLQPVALKQPELLAVTTPHIRVSPDGGQDVSQPLAAHAHRNSFLPILDTRLADPGDDSK